MTASPPSAPGTSTPDHDLPHAESLIVAAGTGRLVEVMCECDDEHCTRPIHNIGQLDGFALLEATPHDLARLLYEQFAPALRALLAERVLAYAEATGRATLPVSEVIDVIEGHRR